MMKYRQLQTKLTKRNVHEKKLKLAFSKKHS